MEPSSALHAETLPAWLSARDPDEDVDPYGNAPPPATPSPGTSGGPPPEAPPPGGGFPTLAVVAAGAVVALLAIGALLAWALWPAGDDTDWHPPVARVTMPPPSAAPLAERIQLDATPSVAAPGRTLTYHWAIVRPEDVDVLFQDEGSPRIARRSSYPTISPLVTAQFFTAGPVVLELRVHDGLEYSDPLLFEFEIVDVRGAS